MSLTKDGFFKQIDHKTGDDKYVLLGAGGHKLISDFATSGHDHDDKYLKLSGGTMSGLITTTSGSSHKGIKVGDTYINAIGGELIFQNNTAIRFGGDSWDWNVWAELGYAHSSKIVYLGLSGSPYSTNSTQTGGKIYTPGISDIYIGNGTYKVWHQNNDGANSGLDADLLDGYHASSFATSGHTHSIKLGGTTITVPASGTTPTATTSITGPFAIDTSADSTKAFSIRRTGDSEAVKHWVDDSEYHIDYTNDEKSSSIHWRIINTDTESPSNPKQTTDFHVYLDSSGNFHPGTNETGSIGTSSYKWKYIYGKTIYGDLTGNVTGNASTATNADKLDGYHATDLYIRNTHMYGLENLCIDVSSGGQTTKVDYKTITTSGTKSDTYFYVKTSENLVDGQIYSFGWYVTGYTGSATWTFYASNNSTCIPIHINKNGWVFGTGKMIVSGAAASNNILIDDAGSSNALVLTFTNFVIVKGDIFPYYTVPISKMSVAYATNAGNASTATKLKTARNIWGQSFDGSADVNDNIYIDTGDTDKFIQFRYNTNNYAGASWRLISRGSGNGDTNYFDIETGGSNAGTNIWNRVIRLTMDDRKVGINTDTVEQSLDVNGITQIYQRGKDNTAFKNLLLIKQQHDTEPSGDNWAATNASFGIGFNRYWTNNSNPYGETNCAGIYATVSSSWRGGLVFRTKNNQTEGGNHDITALRLTPSGKAYFVNQIISSLATGTAPLAVTSTTLNTNLNADLLDGYHANKKGTTDISARHIYSATADNLIYYKIGTLPTIAGTSTGHSSVVFSLYNANDYGNNKPSKWTVTASSRNNYNITAVKHIGVTHINVGYVIANDKMEIWVEATHTYLEGMVVEIHTSQNFTEIFTSTTTKPSNWVNGTIQEVSYTGHTHNNLYVTTVGNGTGSYINQLYYTKNGSNNYFTVNYATNAGNADTVDGCHAYSFATSGHNHDDRYLKLSGGTMTGIIERNAGGSWILGRDNAIIKTTCTSNAGADWHPAVAVKTSVGCWTFGSVGGETLCFSYDTDANYNANPRVNDCKVIYLPEANSEGTLALTSNIKNAALTLQINDTTQTTFYANDNTAKTFNVTCANIGAATSGHNHDGRYVRSYGTTNDNIDSNWGQSIKTFDPIPSGTPPEQNPNITLLSLGDSWNRRKMFAFTYNNDNIYYRRHTDQGFSSWVQLIHSGNIGSQSVNYATSAGNADTVDGYHYNNLPYASWKEQWIDMTGYSESYWHPVVTSLPYRGYNRIKVTVQLNSGTKPSWSTHSSGFTCNLDLFVTAHGWGTTASETICLNSTYGFTDKNPVGWYQLGNDSHGILLLRGGGKYLVCTDWDSSWTIYNQSVTDYEGTQYAQTCGPYTSWPGIFNGSTTKNWIYAHLRGNVITDDWLSIKDYAGSYHGRNNNISGYAGEIWFGGHFHIDSQNSQNLYLNYYTDAIVSIAQGGGYVGIGCDNPSYKLDISGNVRVRSGNQILIGTTSKDSSDVYNGGIQLREATYSTTSCTDNMYDAPGITFHWGGWWVHKLNMHSNDIFWDNSRIWHAGNDGSGSGLDADMTDGLHVHTGRNNEANKIVRTDSYGYIQAGYINSSSGDENNNSNPNRVWGTNGSDSYLRTYKTSALSVGSATKVYVANNSNNTNFPVVFTEANSTNGNSFLYKHYASILYNPYLDSFMLGEDSVASGAYSFAHGYKAKATNQYAHAEGNETTASGDSSHAEGYNTTSSGLLSHAEGNSTVSSGDTSHTEGYATIASGKFAHAEGQSSTASGDDSHAEGYLCVASGKFAHAEGSATVASGYASHTSGEHTETTNSFEAAFGSWNASTQDSTVFSVGGGKENNRSNLFEIQNTGTILSKYGTILDTNNTSVNISGTTVNLKIGGTTTSFSISGGSGSITHKRKNNANKKYVLGYAATESTSALQPNDNSTMSEVWTDSTFYFTNVGAYHSSDARKKYDIRDILNEDVNKLFETENGFIRHFKWINSNNDAYGFIAQELKEYCPEAVDFNEDDGFYAVNYNVAFSKIIGAMFKKIKELERKLQEKENH